MNQVVVLKNHFIATGEKNGKSWKRHDLKDAGGNRYQTFDEALGNLAAGLVDSPVEIEYEIEDRGQYQNNVIKSIKAANGKVEPGQTADDYQGNGAGVVNAVQNSFNGETDRQLRIMRQSALDRAINTVAAGIGGLVPAEVPVSDLFTLADGYINYFENGA